MTQDTPQGIVSFVSSGPGDPELLTVKAVDRLGRADAVLYDDLSSGPILELARNGADLVGVGKRAGRPSPRQDHVSRLLVDYARTGQRVVRLKSGDSGIFGRLEEEITALKAAGLGYEIIPGVPSACAAAAAAGIPLTRRLTARRVQFATGHDISGTLPEDANLAALADPTAVTAIFMGKRTFPRPRRQAHRPGPAARHPGAARGIGQPPRPAIDPAQRRQPRRGAGPRNRRQGRAHLFRSTGRGVRQTDHRRRGQPGPQGKHGAPREWPQGTGCNSRTAPATVSGECRGTSHWPRGREGPRRDDPQVRRPAMCPLFHARTGNFRCRRGSITRKELTCISNPASLTAPR